MKNKRKINISKLILNISTVLSIAIIAYIMIDMLKSILSVMTFKEFILL